MSIYLSSNLFCEDYALDRSSRKNPASRRHISCGEFFVAEMFDRTPAVVSEEVGNGFRIQSEEPESVFPDVAFVETPLAVQFATIQEVFATVRERQTTALCGLFQKCECRPDTRVRQVLRDRLHYKERPAMRLVALRSQHRTEFFPVEIHRHEADVFRDRPEHSSQPHLLCSEVLGLIDFPRWQVADRGKPVDPPVKACTEIDHRVDPSDRLDKLLVNVPLSAHQSTPE